MNEALLTLHEASILFDLAEAWNKYTLLPEHPPEEIGDFRKAVHDAQRIVLARPARRQIENVAGHSAILPEISLEERKELWEQLKALAYGEKSDASAAGPI